jgi:hypothetical protein
VQSRQHFFHAGRLPHRKRKYGIPAGHLIWYTMGRKL